MSCGAIDWAAVGWTLLIMLAVFFVFGFIEGVVSAAREREDDEQW